MDNKEENNLNNNIQTELPINNNNKVLSFIKDSRVIISFIAILLLVGIFIVRYYYIENNAEPNIRLKGDETIFLNVGETFKDPGVVATLNSEDVSSRVKVEGKVDSSEVRNYVISYSISNNKGKNKKTIKRSVVILDSVKPKIKLIGKKKMTASLNEDFQDPGATASDNIDGDLTSQIKVYNKVDTSREGGYEILYEVVDSSNNKSFVKRIVTVADYGAPTIKLVGGKVKLKIGQEYVEPGYTAEDDVDGDLTSEVKVSGTIKTNKPAIYTLTYTVLDDAGNKTTKTRKVYVGTAAERAKYNSIKVYISSQMLYYYKNGELYMSTSVVTGHKGVHDTPRGSYKILYKARNVTLRGPGYASFVQYWMPINGSGVGLHDASWRSSFGGTIYKKDGSHGCINMPTNKAKKLYETAPTGTPVYIYK